MDKALQIAASGMQAQKLTIDVIANNLANVNTTGYKRTHLEFQDLLYETIKAAGEATGPQEQTPSPLQIGNGTRAVATQRSFQQGAVMATENPLDVAIQGDGFLLVRLPDGTTAYTRDGSLKMTADGTLVTSDGYIIEPEIAIPEDADQLIIRKDGQIEVIITGETEPTPLGQLELARFVNPTGLEAIGQNLFRETSASGAPFIGTPGQEGLGLIHQGYLETSNVDVVQEMVEMIEAQRAYELNSKTIKTTEDIYRVVNQLKR
ncbi:MAG: flagellar basal-body rod protein FlgG [Calditrichia bacterium]